jgi:hypothetical protein
MEIPLFKSGGLSLITPSVWALGCICGAALVAVFASSDMPVFADASIASAGTLFKNVLRFIIILQSLFCSTFLFLTKNSKLRTKNFF